MERYMGLLGLLALLVIAFLLSNNKRRFPWRIVIWGLCLQFTFALVILKTDLGFTVFHYMDLAIKRLLSFSDQGSEFIWKSFITDKVETPLECFVVRVLPTIIFFSALTTVFYYFGVMQAVVKAIAYIMRRTMGTSGAETLSCSANIFLGQTEAPLMIRPFVQGMTQSELMVVMTGGFATVSGGVMALYVQWLQGSVPGIAGHLLAASIMSAPAALVISKIMYPETEVSETSGKVKIKSEKVDDNVMEALSRGSTDGVKLAINIAAMLIAFVAMVAMLNYLLGLLGTNVEELLGWAFRPLAFLMGAPWSESKDLGLLLGEKIALTELYAFKDLADMEKAGIVLSERTRVIASYALCGFANFASIGIQIGGIGGMAPDRRKDLAKISIKALIAGALASWTTACIAGVLL